MKQQYSWFKIAAPLLVVLACSLWFLASANMIVIPFIGGDSNPHVGGLTQIQPSQKNIDQEIAALSKVEQTFGGVRVFFVDLAKANGAVYAFAVLKQAPVPPNTDLHLLGHAVGDELYKQEGLDGMQYCDHDLRNACSHSVVIGALLAEGMEVFNQVNEVCQKAPGGSGAYTMCFHGFGHGVLAFAEYDIPDAVTLCKKIGTEAYNNEEAAQCIGGMIMEMFQGIHDPDTWEKKRDEYLDPTDPLKMCMAEYMPEYAKVLCYSYITPYIFNAAGATDGSNPDPSKYPKSFTYCDSVTDYRQRQSCYGGLGKEFVVLSQNRDIRKMEETPDENLRLSVSWCAMAHNKEAETACVLSILDSLYWGGENDPKVSVRHCSLVEDTAIQSSCFDHLFEITKYYQNDMNIRRDICNAVLPTFTTRCNLELL